MIIYIFGNKNSSLDNIALKLIPELELKFPDINFKTLDPNENLDFKDKNPIILDSAKNIDKVRLIKDLDKINFSPRTTLHDFDIAFNLKLLSKIKKINSVRIIAVPFKLKKSQCLPAVVKIIKSLK